LIITYFLRRSSTHLTASGPTLRVASVHRLAAAPLLPSGPPTPYQRRVSP